MVIVGPAKMGPITTTLDGKEARDGRYARCIVKHSQTMFGYASCRIVNRVMTMLAMLRIYYIRTLIYQHVFSLFVLYFHFIPIPDNRIYTLSTVSTSYH